MVALALAAVPAAAAPAPAAAPGGLLATAPLLLSPGPVNGSLTEGLTGWEIDGREPPELLNPGAAHRRQRDDGVAAAARCPPAPRPWR